MDPEHDDVLVGALREAGIEAERRATPAGVVYITRELPRTLEVTGLDPAPGRVVIGSSEAARHVGPIAASGTLVLGGLRLSVHRCPEAPRALRAVGHKIGEAPGNLGRRAEWFRKRR